MVKAPQDVDVLTVLDHWVPPSFRPRPSWLLINPLAYKRVVSGRKQGIWKSRTSTSYGGLEWIFIRNWVALKRADFYQKSCKAGFSQNMTTNCDIISLFHFLSFCSISSPDQFKSAVASSLVSFHSQKSSLLLASSFVIFGIAVEFQVSTFKTEGLFKMIWWILIYIRKSCLSVRFYQNHVINDLRPRSMIIIISSQFSSNSVRVRHRTEKRL